MYPALAGGFFITEPPGKPVPITCTKNLSEGERVLALASREGTRASRRVEEGLSRSLSGGGGKLSFPSPSAGDLREFPRVPLRGEGSCGCGGAPRDSAGFNHVLLFVTPWTVACQAPLSMEFSRRGLSRSFLGGGGKLSFPSPSAGDLREFPRVPLRGEGSCGCGGAPRDSAGQGLSVPSCQANPVGLRGDTLLPVQRTTFSSNAVALESRSH